MKTEQQTTNVKKRIWLAWSLLAMILSLNVACNKSSNNDPAPAPAYAGQFGYGGGCANCNFAQAPLGTAYSDYRSVGLTINWQIYADQNMINQAAAQGMNPQTTYTGPISLQGQMVLQQPVPVGNCMIPAGQYQLYSEQAGTMSYGTINAPLTAVFNGMRIVFNLQNAVVVANGNGQVERISGMLTTMQGPAYNGVGYGGVGMVSCNDYVGIYL